MSVFLLQEQISNEPSVWFVCVLGVGVVFIGLAALVGLVSLMNAISEKFFKANPSPKKAQAKSTASDYIENKQEIIAAVCAAVAEETGSDISALRVVSFKKIQ